MKTITKLLGFVSPFIAGILICGLMLALLSLILGACSPRVILPAMSPDQVDSIITRVTPRTVTDTVLLAGEYVEVHDTFPCPPGLTRDSLVYLSDFVYVPGRTVTLTRTVHDTLRVAVPAPAPIVLPGQNMSWPERISWMLGVLSVLVAWWRKRKAEQMGTT